MSDYFGIGTSSGGIASLEALTVPIMADSAPVKSSFIKYPVLKLLASGATRGQGFPQASWLFSIMSLEERNSLRTYCTGASASVYIKTKKDDDSWANFSAIMIWPKDDSDRWDGNRKNLLINFIHLIEL